MKKIVTRSFILILCLLVGAEIIGRVFFARNVSGRFEYGYNPTAGFVEEGRFIKLIRAGGRRFRPQEFTLQKPDGTLRIFTVGDSVPRGNSLESAYPKQIENYLKTYGLPAESFNLGIAGNGARRNQIVIKQILKYHPDYIILHLNDSNEFEDEREWNRAQAFKSWHPQNWLMKSFILCRLHEIQTEQFFWQFLPSPVRAVTAKNDFDAKLTAMDSPEKEKEWQELVTKVTKEDIELLKEAGVKTILLSKAYTEMDHKTLHDTWTSEFAESLKGSNIYHVSMYEILKDHDLNKIFNNRDGSHMEDYGHSLIASALASRIMEIELPPLSNESPNPKKRK